MYFGWKGEKYRIMKTVLEIFSGVILNKLENINLYQSDLLIDCSKLLKTICTRNPEIDIFPVDVQCSWWTISSGALLLHFQFSTFYFQDYNQVESLTILDDLDITSGVSCSVYYSRIMWFWAGLVLSGLYVSIRVFWHGVGDPMHTMSSFSNRFRSHIYALSFPCLLLLVQNYLIYNYVSFNIYTIVYVLYQTMWPEFMIS